MRLVCPNCSAQYEIDGSMIPDGGRDVQCSNCGHTWFELPPPVSDFGDMSPEDFGQATAEPEPEGADDEAIEATTPDETAAEGSDAEDPAEAANSVSADTDTPIAPEESEDQTHADDAGDGTDEDELSPSGAVAAAAAAAVADEVTERATTDPTTLKPRRPADAAALDILREEAEREMSQRRAPASDTIETQTDMGLDEIRRRETPSRALRARMAHLGEDEPEKDAPDNRVPSEPEAYEEPRRDLLPDIDEINSTLKPTQTKTESAQRSGFLTGFLLMTLVTAGLIFSYAQAPAIARTFPGTESTLITYVDRANSVRDWVNGLFAE